MHHADFPRLLFLLRTRAQRDGGLFELRRREISLQRGLLPAQGLHADFLISRFILLLARDDIGDEFFFGKLLETFRLLLGRGHALALQLDFRLNLHDFALDILDAFLDLLQLLLRQFADLLLLFFQAAAPLVELPRRHRAGGERRRRRAIQRQAQHRFARFDFLAFLDHQFGDAARIGDRYLRGADIELQVALDAFAARVLPPHGDGDHQRSGTHREQCHRPHRQGARDGGFTEKFLSERVDRFLPEHLFCHGALCSNPVAIDRKVARSIARGAR